MHTESTLSVGQHATLTQRNVFGSRPPDSGTMMDRETAQNLTEAEVTLGRVLIVDDEPSLTLAMSHVLTQLGHQVVTAPNGYLGLRAVQHDGLIAMCHHPS